MAIGLVVTLASFVGGFCLHPMVARAVENAPASAIPASPVGADMAGGQDVMDKSTPARNALEASSRNDGGRDAVSGNDNSATVWNHCVVSCASQVPQALAAKKFSVDCGIGLLESVPYAQTFYVPVPSSGATDISGTQPPAPDILSSVFKKE